MTSTLILYMGNPIVKNDQVGLIVGSRIAAFYTTSADVTVRQFGGSPLDLVSDVHGYDRLILIDSISTGRHPLGSVTVFAEQDILSGVFPSELLLMTLSKSGE